jgi:hypothetical protein
LKGVLRKLERESVMSTTITQLKAFIRALERRIDGRGFRPLAAEIAAIEALDNLRRCACYISARDARESDYHRECLSIFEITDNRDYAAEAKAIGTGNVVRLRSRRLPPATGQRGS